MAKFYRVGATLYLAATSHPATSIGKLFHTSPTFLNPARRPHSSFI
jgi:hypothetical protein